MTCVSKEYEVKKKNGSGAMITARSFFESNFSRAKIDFWWGGNKNLVAGIY